MKTIEKLTAIIVDDEERARNVLRLTLEESCPQVMILASVADVPKAVAAINKYNPEVVFLDVEMPGYTGFQLLDFFENLSFKIIFTTAYDEYALQAIKASAIDYLLKPIQEKELVAAVKKAETIINKNEHVAQLANLKDAFTKGEISKLALPTSYGLLFVEINDLLYLEADGSYTNVYLADGQKLLISRKLKEFEYLSDSANFFKTHRSYLVNMLCIKKFIRNDGGYIVMSNDQKVALSREKKEEFIDAIKSSGIG